MSTNDIPMKDPKPNPNTEDTVADKVNEPNANQDPERRLFLSSTAYLVGFIFLLLFSGVLVFAWPKRSAAPIAQTQSLTEDRVRELVNEGLAPVGEMSRRIEEVQTETRQLVRINAEDIDRTSRSVQGLLQRLTDEYDTARRELETLRRNVAELERRVSRVEMSARTDAPVRPNPPATDPRPAPPPRPTPPPSRTPTTINDPVVTITFGETPASGDTTPVEFRFIRMTEAGRVSVQRPDTRPTARPEWLPVRVVRDANGVLWGVLSLPVRTDGEQLTIKYVSHYPPRSAADWGRVSASTSFYSSGSSGDGLTIIVNPRAGTATRGTIR